MIVSNKNGDGVTAFNDVVERTISEALRRKLWMFNGFDVSSIRDDVTKHWYVYPAETLEQFILDVRLRWVPVYRHGTGVIVGEVRLIDREVNSDHPNLIKVGIKFNDYLPVAACYRISPIIKGEFMGHYHTEDGCPITEVTEITGLSMEFLTEAPTHGE